MPFKSKAGSRKWLSGILCAALIMQLISIAFPVLPSVQASATVSGTMVTEDNKVTFVLPENDLDIQIKGSFNNWEQGVIAAKDTYDGEEGASVTYTAQVTGLTPNQQYEFKYTVNGNMQNGENNVQAADENGVLTITKALHFYTAGSFDGNWSNHRELTGTDGAFRYTTDILQPGTYIYKYIMKAEGMGDTYFFDPTNSARSGDNNAVVIPAPSTTEPETPTTPTTPAAYENVTEQPGGLNKWYVTGSFQGWNNQNEATRMKHLSGGFYVLALDLEAGNHAFKFTKNGTWDGYSNDGGDVTFTLAAATKVIFYVNDDPDVNQARISVPNAAGITQYVPALTNETWPRLVGTAQVPFGENEWSPGQAAQFFVDYKFDGSLFKLQRTFPVGSYKAKVVFGNDWNGFDNYGATGKNGTDMDLNVLDPSEVTLTLDLGGDMKLKHDYKPKDGSSDGLIQGSKLLFDSRSVTYKKPFGAIPMGQQDVTLRLAAAKDDLVLARAELINPEGLATAYDMRKVTSVGDQDYFEAVVPKEALDKIGIWGYKFIAVDGSTKMEYGDDATRGGAGAPAADGALPYDLTVYAPDFQTPDWMKNSVVYQIFPDRFFDGNEANNRAKLVDGYRGVRNDEESGGEIRQQGLQYFDGGVADEPAPEQVWGDWNDVPENPDRLKEENRPEYPDAESDGIWTNEFYGGDIQGIEQKLDYLQSIGVTAIYLNPVAWAASNHKYDATDYKHLDPMFGEPVYNVEGDPTSGLNYEATRRASDEVYSHFAKAARERGIRLINDGVFNHVGDDSIYFDRYEKYPEIGAYEYWAKVWHKVNEDGLTQEQAELEVRSFYTSQINPATDENYRYPEDFEFTTWFTIANEKVSDRDHTTQIFKYDAWWGYDSLPAMDAVAPQEGDSEALSGIHEWNNVSYRSHVVGQDLEGLTEAEQQELLQQTVSQRWEWLGGSGWRLDVAPDVSAGTWQKFREAVKSTEGLTNVNGNPIEDPIILGEEWGVATRFLLGDQFDSVMNYRFRGALQNFLINGNAAAMNEALESIREDYPKEAWQVMLNLVASHDTTRSITKLEYPQYEEEHLVIAEEASDVALKKQALTAIFQMGYPGAPTIYYGDEVGLTGTKDPDSRRTFPWERIAEQDGSFQANGRYGDLFQVYQKAADVRNNNEVFRTGDLHSAYAQGDVIAYARKDSSKAGLVVINRGTEAAQIQADVTGFLPDGMTLADQLYGTVTGTVTGGKVSLTVPALTGLMMLSDGSFTAVPEVTGLHATGGNGQVALDWNSVTGAEGYAVYRALIEGGALTKVGDVTGTTFVDTDVVNGTKYYYAVAAKQGVSQSLLGSMVPATPAYPIGQVGTPSAVDPVTLGVGNMTDDITVAITIPGLTNAAAYTGVIAPGITARLVYYKDGLSPAYGTDTRLRYKQDGTAGDKVYYAAFEPTEAGVYRYFAKVSTDNGETWTLSSEQTLTVVADTSDTTAPAAPVLADIVVESNRVELKWTAEGSDFAGFEIYRQAEGEQVFRMIAKTDAAARSYVDYAVSNDMTYTYKVAAYDAAYNRGTSAEKTVKPTLVMIDVTLRVHLPEYTPATEDIYIAGTLNGWSANGNKLTVPSGATTRDVVEYSFKMMAGKQIEYKYTRGTWSKEAFTSHTRVPNDTADYGNWAYSSTNTNMQLRIKNDGGNKMIVDDYVLRWVDMPMMISIPRKSYGEDIAYTTTDSSFKLKANVPYGVDFTINGQPIADEDMDDYGNVEVESIPLVTGLNTFIIHIEPSAETLAQPWYEDQGRAGQATKTITLRITREGGSSNPDPNPNPNPSTPVEKEKPLVVTGPAAEVVKEKTAEGKPIVTVKLDGAKLGEAAGLAAVQPQGEQRVVVLVEDEGAAQVSLSAEALAAAALKAPNAVLSFRTQTASYDLPLNAIDVDRLVQELGAGEKDIQLVVKMEPAPDKKSQVLQVSAGQQGASVLVPAVEFSVTAVAGNKTVSINSFGEYVTRSIILPKGTDVSHATGVMLDEASGELAYVPSVFSASGGDGQVEAVLKRKGNSVYAIVSFNKTFADMKEHWAKDAVEQLASKLIVEGLAENTFAPEEKVTRAQFAALLTRSLGLIPAEEADSGKTPAYTDVGTGDWYLPAVETAAKARLIEGYEDGSFRPEASITRQEMAVMIGRAMDYAGKTGGDTVDLAAKFADYGTVSAWAAGGVEKCVTAGIIQGKGEGTFAPSDVTTRAEAATMLKRLLVYVEFMN